VTAGVKERVIGCQHEQKGKKERRPRYHGDMRFLVRAILMGGRGERILFCCGRGNSRLTFTSRKRGGGGKEKSNLR